MLSNICHCIGSTFVSWKKLPRQANVLMLLTHFLQDYGELESSIRSMLSRQGLQQPGAFVTKVVQMYDTMCVRFGMMLVGPTGGGKTTCCSTLQKALTHLRQELNHPNEQFQVHSAIL
jgi:dynein heavy chain